MNTRLSFLIGLIVFLYTSIGYAEIVIPMHLTEDPSQSLGEVVAEDTPYGLLLIPHLHSLPPGIHGFHIHAMPMCDDSGMAAQGHLDPSHTNKHLGPYSGSGHVGDLPVLIVDEKGNATLPVLAPRLKLDVIQQHALMIHAGGDNYSDNPKKLGGGRVRLACGEIGDHH